jgi:hypothetical protein
MPKVLDVDKARRILPNNAVPGVAELNSNFTSYIAEVNPDVAGENLEPVECGSTADVAANFKPKIEFGVKRLNDIGSDESTEEVVTATMAYGEQPKEIMNDFKADNLVVKMKSGTGEKVLLDQQLTFLALEDLEEKLKDQKFAKLFQTNKEGLIESIEAEIERIKGLKEESEFDNMF